MILRFYDYCQILVRQAEILQKMSKNISRSLMCTNTQKLNCECQELDPTHLLSQLCPPGGFLPHLVNFTLSPKNDRSTIIIANTNSFIGRKILPSDFVKITQKVPFSKKCLNSDDSCTFLLYGKP